MDLDRTFAYGFGCVVAIVFILCFFGKGCFKDENEFKLKAMKTGYTQQQRIGTDGTIWVKPINGKLDTLRR